MSPKVILVVVGLVVALGVGLAVFGNKEAAKWVPDFWKSQTEQGA